MQIVGYLLVSMTSLLIGLALGVGLFWLINRNTSRGVNTAMRDAFDALSRNRRRAGVLPRWDFLIGLQLGGFYAWISAARS